MAAEEPEYRTALEEGAFSVREYPSLIVAQVDVGGERGEAVSAGFRILAAYIFGGNTRRERIAMTAPVVQLPSEGESIAMTAPVLQGGGPGAWTIRFVMPRGYTLDTLPVPNDPRVQLVELPPARVAVVTFSGLAREPDIEQKTTELDAFVAAQGLRVAGPASLARYDPPWTLWFRRRNEILVPLQPSDPSRRGPS